MNRREFNLAMPALLLAGCGDTEMDYELQQSPRLRTSKNTFASGVQGSWTPVITCLNPGDLSVAYGNRYGTYTLIGDLLFLNFFVNFTPTYSTATGALFITGRPYYDRSIAEEASVGACSLNTITLQAGFSWVVLLVTGQTDTMALSQIGSGVSPAAVAMNIGVPSATVAEIAGQISYRISGIS